MGYTTEFVGSLSITPAIKPEHAAYINKFAATRRMKRRQDETALRPDPVREAVGLPIGLDGGYFVGAEGFMGQEWNASDVVNNNHPPQGQPSLWCHWVIKNGELTWNGGEKFYEYVEWLEYLIEHFLGPWGYELTGKMYYLGEDPNDRGVIHVKENQVEKVDNRDYGPSWEE